MTIVSIWASNQRKGLDDTLSIPLVLVWLLDVTGILKMSDGGIFEKNYDELDFEFWKNFRDKNWRLQPNVDGNRSSSMGREERYGLWFDPSENFH
ncbi:hypothetical protein F0562_026304 [Nyssa sinensis]|uniref:GH16 domain-containing protein n=1 Tax=Nyssa sinensis TaxID=561372 RepID=A0A5J5BCI6_9ASTE|nr:hypothetical protein F0562_026304 [Nyssa sinensis]